MVEVIGYYILLSVVIIALPLLTMKAYSLGLKHSYELKHDIQPSDNIGIKNPLEVFKNDKKEKEQASIMSEWLNGKEGE